MEKAKTKKTTKKEKKKEVKKVKKAPPKIVEKKPKPTPQKSSYIEAIGRRKTSVARVRLWTKGEKEFVVNDKQLKD